MEIEDLDIYVWKYPHSSLYSEPRRVHSPTLKTPTPGGPREKGQYLGLRWSNKKKHNSQKSAGEVLLCSGELKHTSIAYTGAPPGVSILSSQDVLYVVSEKQNKTKCLTWTLTKEDTQIANKHVKDAPLHVSAGKCKLEQ